MAYQAIFFDLFNTLLYFDYSLLPEVEFEGKRFRTTTVEVYRRLQVEFGISFSYPLFSRRLYRDPPTDRGNDPPGVP